jgi:hypothetical protein
VVALAAAVEQIRLPLLGSAGQDLASNVGYLQNMFREAWMTRQRLLTKCYYPMLFENLQIMLYYLLIDVRRDPTAAHQIRLNRHQSHHPLQYN